MAPRGMHVNASPPRPQHDCKPKRTSAVKAKENLEQLHGGYHVLLKSRADISFVIKMFEGTTSKSAIFE